MTDQRQLPNVNFKQKQAPALKHDNLTNTETYTLTIPNKFSSPVCSIFVLWARMRVLTEESHWWNGNTQHSSVDMFNTCTSSRNQLLRQLSRWNICTMVSRDGRL